MSKELDKTELVRIAWGTALRRGGHRQCRNAGRDGFGGVCLMEVLREVTGAPREWHFAKVGTLAGLTYEQVLEGICRNDGRSGFHKHSFGELADWLEGLPK